MDNEKLATQVTETKNASSLKIKFDCGLGENGRTLIKSRTYSNLKPEADVLDVYNVAETLESLQKNTLIEVVKQDNTDLAFIN